MLLLWRDTRTHPIYSGRNRCLPIILAAEDVECQGSYMRRVESEPYTPNANICCKYGGWQLTFRFFLSSLALPLHFSAASDIDDDWHVAFPSAVWSWLVDGIWMLDKSFSRVFIWIPDMYQPTAFPGRNSLRFIIILGKFFVWLFLIGHQMY